MKHGSNGTGKIITIALVAGIVGGGATYGGVSYFNKGTNPVTQETVVPNSSNKNGTVNIDTTKVNVQNQSEKAFNSVKNSVVSVVNLQQQSSEDPFASLFGNGSSGSSKNNSSLQASSEGSGVIYKKDGNTAYIVTNNHVVSGSSALEVLLSNGKRMEAKVVGQDDVTDLAVLKINASQVSQVASFGNSDNVKVGETSLAIGSPLGSNYASSLTQGIISAKNREVPQTSDGQQTGNNASVLQTDTAINPGNSGGPLINLAGQVIGINSMKLASDSQGSSVEGIGFAIPSNEVTRIINQLVKDGKVIRPALGVQYVDVANISSKDRKETLKLPDNVNEGAAVVKVVSNSPAKEAGISKYDVITKLDGKKITDQGKIRSVLYSHHIGDTIPVTYYHQGQEKTSQMKLTKQMSQLNFK